MWFNHDEFKKLLKEEWKNLNNLPLKGKVKALKRPIQEWCKLNSGDVKKKVELLSTEDDKLIAIGDLNELELARLRAIHTRNGS